MTLESSHIVLGSCQEVSIMENVYIHIKDMVFVLYSSTFTLWTRSANLYADVIYSAYAKCAHIYMHGGYSSKAKRTVV